MCFSHYWKVVLIIVLLSFLIGPADPSWLRRNRGSPRSQRPDGRLRPPLPSKVGVEILKKGGNAWMRRSPPPLPLG